MSTKHLLLRVAVAGAVLAIGTKQAFAQEDEAWYRARQQSQQKHLPKGFVPYAKQGQQITAQRSACDFVLNGDMETQIQAPSYTGNMGGGGPRTPQSNSPDQLADWYSPTLGTPDYLATNATNNDVDPNSPFGFSGTSTPRSGIGEIGLYNRQAFTDTDGRVLDRTSEYATVRLGSTLSNTSSYYAEMWVSLSNSAGTCNYGVRDGFGMWFTPTVSFQNLQGRNFLPQPTTQFISNTSPIDQGSINNGSSGAANWQRIAGIIQGNGENYVTIGDFNANATNLVLLPNRNPNRLNTYVFVDDFQLYKIPTAGASPASVCSGASVTLGEGCSIPGATYTWSAPGVTGLPTNSSTIPVTVNPTANTTYTLTVNLPNGTTSTSNVTVTIVTGIDDPQVQTPEWPCEYGPGPIKAYIDNYDPKATYTITTTNNIRNSPFPGSIFSTQTPSNPGWYFYLRSVREGATGLVTVTVKKCGYTGTTTFNITSPAAGCGGGPTESVLGYPNPATDRVQLPAGIESATLVNDKGKSVQKADASGKLDVQSLPDGLYNLQMMQNGKLINQRIQVKH